MTRTKKESITIDQIVAEFISPIDTYKFDDKSVSNEEIEIESYEEATEFLNKIADNLSPSKSWKIRCEAIDRTIKLLKAGIQYYPEGDLQGIAPLIATAISDLRPVIIRKASLLVAIAAKLLKEDFTASAVIIFPSLLKQVSSKNQIISNYCHCALLEIVKYTSSKQIGLLFINNYSSKIASNRQVAAESCHIIFETWPSKVASSLTNFIFEALEKLSNDSNEVVRNIADQAISISRPNSPKRKRGHSTLPISPTGNPKRPLSPILRASPVAHMESISPRQVDQINRDINQLTNNYDQAEYENDLNQYPNENTSLMDYQNLSQRNIENIPENQSPMHEKFDELENIEKSPQTHKSSKNNLTLQDVLLPKTKKAAVIFKSCLDVIVETKNFDTIDSVNERDFVSSILYSIQQIPTIDLWKDDLAALFDIYPNLFESKIINIMSNFSFDPIIYHMATSTYTTQTIADMFVSGRRQRMSDAFNFFTTAFKTEPGMIIINDKMKSCIQILIQSKPKHDDTHFLIEALKRSEESPTIQTIVESIILKLQNNEYYEDELKFLSKTCDGNSKLNSQVESRFDEVIPIMISKGTDEEKQNAIQFIVCSSSILRKVSFLSSVDPIFSLIINQNCGFSLDAIECLGKMMSNVKVLAEVIQKIDKEKDNSNSLEILIEAMRIYFTYALPQKMIIASKIVTEKLLPFITSQNSEIRKTVIQIFAEFQRKIPKEFSKILNKKFTPSQKRLIEITAQKPKPVLKQ